MSDFVRSLTIREGLVQGGDATQVDSGSMTATGVNPGSYGDNAHTLTITTDMAGRITAIVANAINTTAQVVSSLPAPGTAGRLATLTSGNRGLNLDNGSAWVDVTSGVYNAESFGVSPANADNTAAVNAVLAAANATGGTIVFPPGTIICLGQIVVPNDGASPPKQANMRWEGSASHASGYGSAVVGGTVLDLRYSVGREFADGITNGTTTLTSATANFTAADAGKGIYTPNWATSPFQAGTTIVSVQSATSCTLSATATAATGVDAIIDAPKIDTRGAGRLSISGITFADGGSANGTPFLRTTNTTLRLRDCAFIGNGSGTSCKQDAIILGGVDAFGGSATTSPTQAFQGYATTIKDCYFDRIRTGVLGQTFANGAIVRDNTFWVNCGGGDSTHAAIQFVGGTGGGMCAGGTLDGNLIECANYTYGILLDNAQFFTLIGNNGYDESAQMTAFVRLGNNAQANRVLSGFFDYAHPYLSDARDPTATNNEFWSSSAAQVGQQPQSEIVNNNVTSTQTSGVVKVFTVNQNLNPPADTSAAFAAFYTQITTNGSANYNNNVNTFQPLVVHAGSGLAVGLGAVNSTVLVVNTSAAASFTQASAPYAMLGSVEHDGSGIVQQARAGWFFLAANGTGQMLNSAAVIIDGPKGGSTANIINPAGLIIGDQGSTGVALRIDPQSGQAMWIRGGAVKFDAGTTFGFGGVAPAGQQAITGALSAVTDANAKAVLTSLLDALVAFGLVSNGTT